MIVDIQTQNIFNTLNIGIIILNESLKVIFTNSWIKGRLDPVLPFHEGSVITELVESSERFINSLIDARDDGRSSLISCKLNKLPFRLVHGGIELSFNLIISRIESEKEGNNILIQVLDVTQVKHREEFLINKQKEVDVGRAKSFNRERLVSLGELSSSMAHEINNPLAILELSNKVLEKLLSRRNLLSSEIKEVLQNIKDTLKRIKDLVVSIKNLARDSENEKFSESTLDSVLQDVLPVLSARAKTAGIDLKYDPNHPAFNTPVECVRSLLGQVFVNMFANSFHEVKKLEEKWIEISAAVKDNVITIHFTDSGKGIPEVIKDKIFLPFYTTKGIGEGTGLGLSTVLKIAEIHSGEIKLSENYSNTRFTLILPLQRK